MNVNLRLNQALDQWHEWDLNDARPPVAIRRLPGGLTNQNFSLQCGPHHLVLRLNHTDDKRLNILRPVELAIQRYMAHIGFSPKVHYVSEEQGYWVRDYVAGNVLQTDLLTSDTLAGMARLLHSVHHIDIRHLEIPPLEFSVKAMRYLTLLKQEQPQHIGMLTELEDCVLKVGEGLPEGYSLCHMDPLPANWISQPSGLLTLLDWEYAARAHPLLDFVAVYRALPGHLRPLWLKAANVGDESYWAMALRQVGLLEKLWLVAEGQAGITSLRDEIR